MKKLARITFDPNVMGGKPCIRGMRVTVGMIVGMVVFTHDLDFGAILAATQANAPSALQLRAQNVDPSSMARPVIAILREHSETLQRGALISFDESTHRVRILPIRP